MEAVPARSTLLRPWTPGGRGACLPKGSATGFSRLGGDADAERKAAVNQLADVLEANIGELAELVTRE